MTDRFLFGIIIDDTIIKNSEAKWREKDRKKIKGLVSGGNLPYHAQRGAIPGGRPHEIPPMKYPIANRFMFTCH